MTSVDLKACLMTDPLLCDLCSTDLRCTAEDYDIAHASSWLKL